MESGAIRDHMLAGTSSFGVLARLNGWTAWVPRHNNLNQYLIVDFGRPTTITGISTQGRHDANQYVTGYTISVRHGARITYLGYRVGGILKVK